MGDELIDIYGDIEPEPERPTSGAAEGEDELIDVDDGDVHQPPRASTKAASLAVEDVRDVGELYGMPEAPPVPPPPPVASAMPKTSAAPAAPAPQSQPPPSPPTAAVAAPQAQPTTSAPGASDPEPGSFNLSEVLSYLVRMRTMREQG